MHFTSSALRTSTRSGHRLADRTEQAILETTIVVRPRVSKVRPSHVISEEICAIFPAVRRDRLMSAFGMRSDKGFLNPYRLTFSHIEGEAKRDVQSCLT